MQHFIHFQKINLNTGYYMQFLSKTKMYEWSLFALSPIIIVDWVEQSFLQEREMSVLNNYQVCKTQWYNKVHKCDRPQQTVNKVDINFLNKNTINLIKMQTKAKDSTKQYSRAFQPAARGPQSNFVRPAKSYNTIGIS